MNVGLKVFAPATVSNLAVGFDLLGFALDAPGDEVIVRFREQPGLVITRVTGAAGKLPTEIDKNTAGVAAMALLRHLGEENRGIAMEVHKKMPFGSGLGSSAASAVGGVVAVNELLNRPLEKRDLLPFAMQGERVADGAWHADNVAPCLLGGMIFIRDNESLDVHRVHVPSGLFAAVVHPKVEVLTRSARSILSEQVALEKHIRQSGNLGGLLIGLFQSDFELISRSLHDHIIEPQRAKLIPHFDSVKEKAMEAGALGCSISGAGPSVFALCSNSLLARQVGQAMESAFRDRGLDCELFVSGINAEGAKKC